MTDTDAPAGCRGRHVRANRGRAFDFALGARIRALRTAARMSRAALGQAAGLSVYQVQKYEVGKDRVAASTLFVFAAVLNIPPKSFYEGDELMPAASGADDGVAARIVVLFQQIGDARVQKRLVDLAKVLAMNADGGAGVRLRQGKR